MYLILAKKILSDAVVELKVQAPEIAAKARPGHFIIVRHGERGERIPLTIADWSKEDGSVDFVIQAVGYSTKAICALNPGDNISDLAGPLGQPAVIDRVQSVICVAGGIGAAPIFPQARAYQQLGAKVTTILGARSADLLTWQDRLASISETLITCTDDGSAGEHGMVTAPLQRILQSDAEKPERIVAIGPVPMMKAVAETTRPYCIRTYVSLNPIMIDGTGMCGCCRVSVGGQTFFSCVDGPDFDGHLVDFDSLSNRQRAYRTLEKEAQEHHCRCNTKEAGQC
ncbi:MAG TPA: sulfide/dihydroorotate dehydrogenase-like FAD/NAD-binding protein [Firmicutes bacterium]|nr:sulfide/dihydroorotate dehydrogenase-like FAD/NAD-binding protein [Bacillota bacterium]HCF90330.1 sulfide/dihydroorotate dehydrogenase-like FAD/NAD-binding protein [Bacillota bacterium]